MKIIGYRSLTTVHRWGRPIGDVNGTIKSGITEVPILLLITDSPLIGVGVGGHADIARIFPAIEGEDPRSVVALYDQMQSQVFKSGHAGSVFGAIGVADMALWDLKAKMAGEPLWRMLGARKSFVPGYASGLDFPLSLEELLSLHKKFVDLGFTAFKLKGGLDVENDIKRLKALKELYSKNTSKPAIMVDVNESMNCKQAVAYVKHLEKEVPLVWIEEPVRRWDAVGHAKINRAVDCSVATGENLTGLEQFIPLMREGSVDVVQTGMCWGISHFLRVAMLAQAHDLPISPVGYNANPVAHAAAAVSNHLGCEIQDLHFPFGLKVDQVIKDGGIHLGDSPGLGFEVDEKAIAQEKESGSWTVKEGPHVRPSRAGLRLN